VSLERIEITPFAVIVGELLQERRTGNLTVIRAPLRKVLYWSQGELVLITSSAPEDSLSDFLVRRGVLAALSAINDEDVLVAERVSPGHHLEGTRFHVGIRHPEGQQHDGATAIRLALSISGYHVGTRLQAGLPVRLRRRVAAAWIQSALPLQVDRGPKIG